MTDAKIWSVIPTGGPVQLLSTGSGRPVHCSRPSPYSISSLIPYDEHDENEHEKYENECAIQNGVIYIYFDKYKFIVRHLFNLKDEKYYYHMSEKLYLDSIENPIKKLHLDEIYIQQIQDEPTPDKIFVCDWNRRKLQIITNYELCDLDINELIKLDYIDGDNLRETAKFLFNKFDLESNLESDLEFDLESSIKIVFPDMHPIGILYDC